MRSLLLFFILFTSSASFAELKLQSISGASRLRNFASAGVNTSVQIYGGFAGAEVKGCAPGSANSTSTCNNCDADGAGYLICNEARAHDNLQLTFTFASTTLAIGTPKVTLQLPGATSDTQVTPVVPPVPTTQANQLVSVSVLWGTLKNAFKNGTTEDCQASACTLVIRVGLDSSSDNFVGTGGGTDDFATVSVIIYEPQQAAFGQRVLTGTNQCSTSGGLCNYSLFPGDGKASIEYPTIVNPPAGLPIANLIFLCIPGSDYTQIPSYAAGLRRVAVVGGGLSENVIDGLSNHVLYSCRSAIEDEAGNIGLFSGGADPSLNTDDLICPPDTGANCHQVTPDEVVALFKETQNCFIATAAYGTPWMAEVRTLRKFRSEFLTKFSLGRHFIHWYYLHAPPVAQWISESPTRRFGARVLLAPIFAAAYLAVHWPMATLSFLIGLLFVFFFRRFYTLRTR